MSIYPIILPKTLFDFSDRLGVGRDLNGVMRRWPGRWAGFFPELARLVPAPIDLLVRADLWAGQ